MLLTDRMRNRITGAFLLAMILLTARPLTAHPGSGIVVDRMGQVYFVDMVAGIWKIDTRGALTHIAGSGFHWMALDASNRFASARLPSGSNGDVERIGGNNPTLLIASDYPIAVGRDGNLYYPSHTGSPVHISRYEPTGNTSLFATVPVPVNAKPIRDLNGIAAGADGSIYFTENAAVRRAGSTGVISTVVDNVTIPGCKANPYLRGLDLDTHGNVYAAATGCGTVIRVTPAGRVTVLPQVKNAWTPTGVAVHGDDVYVLEFQNADSDDRREMLPRVRKIAGDGKTAVIAVVTHH